MSVDLSGRSALVTGASRGIGEAAARELARSGAAVTLLARSEGDCARIAREIEAEGGRAIAVRGDVADYASVEAAFARAEAAHGAVDLLVNNAGLIEPIARLDEADPAEWARVVNVNLTGAFHCIRAALPPMLRAGRGDIVNISSGAATGALEGWSHYCATKAGLLSLTRCVHKEAGERGVRCVGLSPGTVATDMQQAIRRSGVNPVSQLPWERHIPPEWVGRAIAWLASEAARGHPLVRPGTDFTLKSDEERAAVGLG